MKRIAKFFIIFFLCTISYTAFSQELSIVSFEEMTMDLKARVSPRVDNNNEPCALLRVEIPTLENLNFTGGLGIVGNVEHHPGEYLVYLPNGTKKIAIKHSDFLPLTISFQDYGIKSLIGQTTYKLTLGLPKNTGHTTILSLKTNVPNAFMEINGQKISTNNASFNVPLPKGEYDYTVSTDIPGFTAYSGKISISGDDVVTEIPRINLSSDKVYSLTIYSDKNASVLIDGEVQEKNGIFTVNLPAGLHTIEAKCGTGDRWYLKREKDLSVGNDSVSVQLRGLLSIVSPKEATFTISPAGEAINPDKSKIKSGESIHLLGNYSISAKKKGYAPVSQNIMVGVQDNLSQYYIQMTSEADMLYFGLNGKKANKQKAKLKYESLISTGDDQAMLSYGKICIDEGNWSRGISYIKKAAELGNIAAMQYAYENVKLDSERSTYAEMAANRGDVKAMVFLAGQKSQSFKSNTSDNDAKIALMWYMRAFESGDNTVLGKIGDFYYYGWGIPQDYRTAYTFYSEGAIENNIHSKAKLADYYYYGLAGKPKDEAKALSSYNEVIISGYSDDFVYHNAAFLLLRNGDLSKCGEYLMRIKDKNLIIDSEQFKADNLKDLAEHHLTSNPSYAIAFYTLSFDMGNTNPESYENIGKLYYMGRGTIKNVQIAKSYFEKAAVKSPKTAYLYLGHYYRDQKQYSKAKECYEIAINKGNTDANGEIGTMYYNGQGVTKNNGKAVENWQIAAANGHQLSIRNLIKYYEYKKNYEAVNKWKQKLEK